MSLNSTPSSNRIHIGFFGRRNAGKSSIVNAVTGQELAVVSDVLGTTTDPVQKSMELLPLGPVVIIDTPGIDDEGSLGQLRVRKTKQILNKTDIAILVVDGSEGMKQADLELVELFQAKELPYVIVYNKTDLMDTTPSAGKNEIYVSALRKQGIEELKNLMGTLVKTDDMTNQIVGDLLEAGDLVVLVTPIDSAAPKGRLILPQQQTIRDVLEAGAISVVCRETELSSTLNKLGTKPKLVITDSQAFGRVNKETPADIALTSFSILFARYKGNLRPAVQGAAALSKLEDGAKILISEGCTHHRQCGDIGSVKLPKWLHEFTGKNFDISLSSGIEFPDNLEDYDMIIHCGGCMLNEREMQYRYRCAKDANVPITNYGIAIAHMHGILRRTLEPFPDILKELDA